MTNQLQDLTEKHRQRQLLVLKCKQTFRVTVAQYPRIRKNINSLKNNRCYRNVLLTSDFTYNLI